MAIHRTAADGFDAAAAVYDRARPGYPAPAVSRIRERTGLGPGRRVLDLAAGTGKLTRALLTSGADVEAVEPVPAMRQVLIDTLPDVTVHDGTAEAIPAGPASFDVVTVGQAFHWFDTQAALSEIWRVLVPRGWLAVVFNTRDLDTPAQAAIDDLLRPVRGDTPSWGDHRWRDALTAPAGFDEPEFATWPNEQHVDEDGFVDRVASTSFVAAMHDAERTSLLARAHDRFAELQQDGGLVLHHRTELWLAQRADDGHAEP